MEDPIDLLEKRIAALELKVLPTQETNLQQCVSDMLLEINTLISSALSCRDIVTTILNRMSELNEYLDPNFCEKRLDINAKRQFILAVYPEIKKYSESIPKLKKLLPVLESVPLTKVSDMVPKLEQLTISSLDNMNESDQISISIYESLQQYNNIIHSITKTFIQLEEIVTRIEADLQPKTVVE